uniref:Uncharacterized protein n=1 Tax=Ananas comosus var. bracteatus TaxID=296719 RepID=A0A6V7P4Z2_ANACO|nr:unnamed protein product [Ananas comosus var. bracteatus]
MSLRPLPDLARRSSQAPRLISGVLQISICYFKSDSATWHLLDKNEQLLIQIASNLELFKIQENMDPFLRTSNNIATILNRYVLPVISSQSNESDSWDYVRMPPLPISLNEEHLNSFIQFSRRLFLWTILPRQAPLRSSAFLPQQWASFSFKSLNSIE